MRPRATVTWVLLGLAAFAWTVPACSGTTGDDDTSEVPTTQPPTTTPSTQTPGTETPGTATPGTETPGTATPGTATPGTATPGTATPGTATPGTATPGTATPGTETPGTATPPDETPTPATGHQLQLSATSLSFGPVTLGEQGDQDLELTNTGSSTLLVTITLPVNPGAQYKVQEDGQPVPDSLAGGESVTLTVTFTPTVVGASPGKLRIDSSDASRPRVDIPLSASGTEASSADEDGDGFSPSEGDCNDSDPDIHPEAEETCDGIDNDCDGSVDDDPAIIAYFDGDGDGYGDPSEAVLGCVPLEDYVDGAGDCDDDNAGVHPGAAEVCDGIDNDCDVSVDENVQSTFYRDVDGDGYGRPFLCPPNQVGRTLGFSGQRGVRSPAKSVQIGFSPQLPPPWDSFK